jgi:hypothetical protein
VTTNSPNVLTSVLVTRISEKVKNLPTTVSIKFTTTNPVPQNGKVTIYIPLD